MTLASMQAIEFEAEIQNGSKIVIPSEFAEQIPAHSKARVIILFSEYSDEELFRRASYEHFLRDDSPEDSVYDKYA